MAKIIPRTSEGRGIAAQFLAKNVNIPNQRRKRKKCEEPDSNRRTPAGIGPEPIAFDLARRSSRLYRLPARLNKGKVKEGLTPSFRHQSRSGISSTPGRAARCAGSCRRWSWGGFPRTRLHAGTCRGL